MTPEGSAARYEHDGCDGCVFLGGMEAVEGLRPALDLWFCPQGGSLPTVIARFSDDPPDYESGIHGNSEPLIEARRRARERGLLDAQYA